MQLPANQEETDDELQVDSSTVEQADALATVLSAASEDLDDEQLQ